MEKLLDEADALLLIAGENGPRRPNFEIPEELHALVTPSDRLHLLENPKKGRGWVAKENIPAGTILMVAKPIVWMLDGELYEDEMDEELEVQDEMDESTELVESRANEMLILQVLQTIKETPSIWFDQITNLFPRDMPDANTSPAWVSKDENIKAQFQTLLQDLEKIPAFQGKSHEISRRLPLIIRYNVLSVETCPELLSYPGPSGHVPLGGVGLYYLPSYFNHDARPNASRYAVGDIMWFVANQDIPVGQEVCISYLEHDILCESVHRRNELLSMDFQEDVDPNTPQPSDDDEGPFAPVVDSEVQNELMSMNPFERMDAIEELMEQAAGESLPEGEAGDGMEGRGSAWFECDAHNLRVLKAITLDALGKPEMALQNWEHCMQFTTTRMPPNDESSIVMKVQAALSAFALKDEVKAKQYAESALYTHNLMFGGGLPRFRRRYRKEFCLNLRPSEDTEIPPHDMLWPSK